MWNLPCGFMSAMCGTRAPTRLKSSSSSATPASKAMASRCSTMLVEPPSAMPMAMAFSNASLVRMSRGRMSWARRLITAWPLANAKSSRRRSTAGADELPGSDMPIASADRRHRVGGEHARARPLGRARPLLDLAQLVLGEGAGGTRAHGLEHAHDVERLVLVVTREDRAAVEEDRRQVEPGRRHHHPGQALVAPREGDHGVEPLGVHDALDRVGDDLARHERAPHALVAHRDAVAHRDGDELDREAPGLPDALLGPLRQAVERHVAGGDLVPATTPRRSGACPSRRRSSRWPGAWPGPAPAPSRR